MADRAVTPVVGKTLEVGILVLYVALVSSVLFGGVVPEYRSAAGAEIGDRTLATATDAVEAAVVEPTRPGVDVSGERRVTVELPSTIRGAAYEIRSTRTADGTGSTLVLEHPSSAIGGRSSVALPGGVEPVEGEWRSGSELIVVVTFGSSGNVEVRLT